MSAYAYQKALFVSAGRGATQRPEPIRSEVGAGVPAAALSARSPNAPGPRCHPPCDYFLHVSRIYPEKAANEEGARALVGRWDQAVTGFTALLPRLDTDPAYGPARKAMLGFGRDLGAQPGALAVLRERGDAFGMGERQTLARVVADAQPERAVGVIVETAETRTRAHLQEQAQQRAAQDAARRQEQASRPQLTPGRGPRMGM